MGAWEHTAALEVLWLGAWEHTAALEGRQVWEPGRSAGVEEAWEGHSVCRVVEVENMEGNLLVAGMSVVHLGEDKGGNSVVVGHIVLDGLRLDCRVVIWHSQEHLPGGCCCCRGAAAGELKVVVQLEESKEVGLVVP